MVRALLEDRFRLRTHVETSQGPVYELTVSRGGSKLRSSSCTTFDSPERLPASDRVIACGNFTGTPAGPNKTLVGRGIPMVSNQGPHAGITLAAQLSILLGRTVIDETGLTGRFDFRLQWSDQAMTGSAPPGDSGAVAPSTDTAGPSIFTALQQQLGLKLESARGPVEHLVIDHVERPDEN
jgi:uncharacterized protein (TIGR03435 family)